MEARPVSPPEFVRALDGAARHVTTTLPGGGTMAWRVWGSGPALVLLHGGYGSWLHWARNVGELSQGFTVVAPDMPGFGQSDRAQEPVTIDMLSEIVAEGLREVLGTKGRYRIVGFSFGSVIGGHMARFAEGAIDQLIVVGFNRLNLWPLARPPMMNWRAARTPEEREAAHRHNLAAMMIHDRSRIDELAAHLQTVNTGGARVRSLDIVQSHGMPARLMEVDAPVAAIWGEHDVTLITGAGDAIRALERIVPGVRCVVIPGAGHWVQFEAAEEFNAAVREAVAEAPPYPASSQSTNEP